MYGESQSSADQGAGSGARDTGRVTALWKFGTSPWAMICDRGAI
jgi:hypothetical protein